MADRGAKFDVTRSELCNGTMSNSSTYVSFTASQTVPPNVPTPSQASTMQQFGNLQPVYDPYVSSYSRLQSSDIIVDRSFPTLPLYTAQPTSTDFENLSKIRTVDQSLPIAHTTLSLGPDPSVTGGEWYTANQHRITTEGQTNQTSLHRVSAGPPVEFDAINDQTVSGTRTVEDYQSEQEEEQPPKIHKLCPPEARYIIESRWKHRHRQGLDLWDIVQAGFYQKFKKKRDKGTLQMIFKRARTKYIQWTFEDLQILRQAWATTEQDRYATIMTKYLELGGSHHSCLTPADIEFHCVATLKMEENCQFEGPNGIRLRRRRKNSLK